MRHHTAYYHHIITVLAAALIATAVVTVSHTLVQARELKQAQGHVRMLEGQLAKETQKPEPAIPDRVPVLLKL